MERSTKSRGHRSIFTENELPGATLVYNQGEMKNYIKLSLGEVLLNGRIENLQRFLGIVSLMESNRWLIHFDHVYVIQTMVNSMLQLLPTASGTSSSVGSGPRMFA